MRCERVGGATLYLGDCLAIPLPAYDCIITDPPYPQLDYGWEAADPQKFDCSGKQFWFWMNIHPFPDFTARHVWVKRNVFLGGMTQYEVIYERNGGKCCGVFDAPSINSRVAAQMARDEFHGHPTQKPVALMKAIIGKTKGIVFDPYMGTGTTGVACLQLGRQFVGVEKDEKYFDIACERMARIFSQPELEIA